MTTTTIDNATIDGLVLAVLSVGDPDDVGLSAQMVLDRVQSHGRFGLPSVRRSLRRLTRRGTVRSAVRSFSGQRSRRGAVGDDNLVGLDLRVAFFSRGA